MNIVVMNSSYSTIMDGKRTNTEALKQLLLQNDLFTNVIDDIFHMYSNKSVNSSMTILRKIGTYPESYSIVIVCACCLLINACPECGRRQFSSYDTEKCGVNDSSSNHYFHIDRAVSCEYYHFSYYSV